MKKILILVLCVFILVSCTNKDFVEYSNLKTETVSSYELSEITYDSCEYVVSGYAQAQMIAHKGNCKYCAMRELKQWEHRIQTLQKNKTN